MSNTVKAKHEECKNSIDDQIKESLANIKAGNFKDFTIPEYKKELRKRYHENEDLDNSRT